MSAQGSRRQSWEILADLCDSITIKALAYNLHLNPSLVYDWCKEPDDDLIHSSRRNPLDRTREIVSNAMTNGRKDIAVEVINWLAAELGGVYVADEQLNSIEGVLEGVKAQARRRGK